MVSPSIVVPQSSATSARPTATVMTASQAFKRCATPQDTLLQMHPSIIDLGSDVQDSACLP